MDDFEFAWKLATKRHPPSLRDRQRIPAWGSEKAMTLFDEAPEGDAEIELSVAETLKVDCFTAWHGFKPTLRHFSLEMLAGEDHSRPASPHGRLNAAA
jgi:hypothetical protein